MIDPIRRPVLVRVCAPISVLFAGCGPLPPATPPSSEIPALTSRVQRTRADLESVIRLAAGLWARGEAEAALGVLREAREAVPEAAIYAAAIGVALEGLGDYEAARTAYLDYVGSTYSSELAESVLARVDAMRGETAASLVRELIETGRPLNHGLDAGLVVAVVPIEAPADDPELSNLAAVATELLVGELRTFPLQALDWELTGSAQRALTVANLAAVATGRLMENLRGFPFHILDWDAKAPRWVPTADPDGFARPLADLLNASRVVWTEVERTAGDTIVFSIHAIRVVSFGREAFEEDTFVTTLPFFGADRARLTDRVWEMSLGAAPGAGPLRGDEHPMAPADALLAFGEGLLAADTGDRERVTERFAAARALAPEFPPLLERIRLAETFDAFRSGAELPLADEMLALANRQAAVRFLLREAGTTALGSPARHGISETFGLDRLGAQVFADLVFSHRGAR